MQDIWTDRACRMSAVGQNCICFVKGMHLQLPAKDADKADNTLALCAFGAKNRLQVLGLRASCVQSMGC